MDFDKYEVEVRTIFNEGVYINQLDERIYYTSVVKKPGKWAHRIVYRMVKYLPSRILYTLFIDGNYDVEVAFLEILASRILAGSNSKAFKISWIHSDMFKLFGYKHLYYTKKHLIKCYQNYDKVVCVSQSTREDFVHETGLYQDTITIYNPIDTNSILKKSNEQCDIIKDINKITFISIGRLVPQKGYLRLLEVFNQIKEKYDNFELWILGEGKERKTLENYISKNNLDRNVKLLGFKENPYKYLANADVFISCSVAEGFSLVVGEAITLGIPVISTNTLGPINILDNGKYGLIVDNSFEGLYEGIVKIFKDKKFLKELKNRAIERQPFFELNNKIEEIESLLDFKDIKIEDKEVFCTVFTPAYNRGYIIGKLYDSLKRQTFKNFEWLVVDDGSTDNTEKLFTKWINEEKRFKITYVKQENGGKHRAINKGLTIAGGKMFFIVDSDDYLTDDALEKVYKAEKTIKNSIDFAGISFNKEYENKAVIGGSLSKDYIDALNSDRSYYHIDGDRSEVYYTDVLKKYPFPEIEGEKFISESVVYNRISKDCLKLRWFNDEIYVCDYLEDGLTNQGLTLFKKNPRGYLIFIRNMINISHPTLFDKFRCYCGYYEAVNSAKALKEITTDLGISVITLKLAIFAKKVKTILKGDNNA